MDSLFSGLDPKARLIVCTLSTVAVTCFIVRRYLIAQATLPGALQSAGQVSMSGAMPAESEARRDYCRAFMGGVVTVLPPGAVAPEPLVAPADLPKGVDAAALEAQEEALLEALGAALASDGVAPPPGALRKLLPFLSVSPTIAVLDAAGVPPMVQQHRFAVCSSLHGEAEKVTRLRVLVAGFVGTPVSGASPSSKHTPYLLAVASSNALASSLEAAGPSPVLSYTVTRTAHKDILRALPGAVASLTRE